MPQRCRSCHSTGTGTHGFGSVPGMLPAALCQWGFHAVRFEMSYWTSLGNFNILKRKIKKKEKEKKTPTFTQSRPRIPGALYGCTRCAPVAAAPLSLTSISSLVLPPALSSLCRDFRLLVRRWSRLGTRRGSEPGAPGQGGTGAGTAAVRACDGSAGIPPGPNRSPPASPGPPQLRRAAIPAEGKERDREGKSCCGPTFGCRRQR